MEIKIGELYMKCPICQHSELEKLSHEIGMQLSFCPICNSYWIQPSQFWAWKDKYITCNTRAVSYDRRYVETFHLNRPKKCPECSRILSRYQVGKGTDITIERCEKCRGMWIDKSDFDLLYKNNLLGEIYRIFSTQWQASVKMEKILEKRADALKREIGINDYNRVNDFLKWVKNNQKKTSIIAYLNYVS